MAPVAFAQDEESVEEVVVTGSRIVRKDLQAASPVTVLNAEEVANTGVTRIEDLVTSLPQAFAAQNSTVANGASGTATVNLRHLGASRTLVLINGRRTAAGDPFTPAADLNFIPTALIQRVDVLTGGASSVYGADAVAGVVNFILDTDFEGIKLNAQYSFYQHNNNNSLVQGINADKGFDYPTGNVTDGETWNLSMAAGGAFADGRGHASGYITYRKVGSIVKGGRDYTNCTVSRGSSGPTCGGSSTTPWGRFIGFNEDYSESGDWAGTTVGSGWRDRTSADVFNYGPFNHIQRPDTTYTGGGFVNYQINEKVEGYVEVMFMDNYTEAQIAPTGNFGRTTTMNCGNPLLSAGQFGLLCEGLGWTPEGQSQADYLAGLDPMETGAIANLTMLRRNIEGGPRNNVISHTNWRVVGGFRGDLNDTWSYDAFGMVSKNNAYESYINDMNVDRITDALLAVTDADGNVVCASAAARANGCQPWNVFTQGAVLPNGQDPAVQYMTTTAVMYGSTSSKMLSGSMTGDLGDYNVKMPWAEEGAQVAIGAEYREEALSATPDEVYSQGLRAGSGGRTPPVNGGFNVTELFAEAVVPLVQGHDMADDLSLELAYRYSEYNLSGGANTYKAGLTWQVNDDIKFRGGYNRAVRAPNALDLFRPQGFGLGGSEDICANDPATGEPSATLEQCLRTGVTEAQYGSIIPNPANQYNTLGGGNPNLGTETADTYTLGAVITPAALPGFSATVDYYNIKIDGAIGTLAADDIIQTCANTGDTQLCGLIHRDNAGTLWLTSAGYTEVTNQNINSLKAEGIDVNANYNLQAGEFGDVDFSMVGTYLLSSRFTNPLTDYDCVGYFGSSCGQPDSKWRSKVRVTWNTTFGTAVSFNWRFIGKATNEDFSPDTDLGSSSTSLKNSWIANNAASISGKSFFDLTVRHQVTDSLIASIGVNNILDSEPPLVPTLDSTGFSGTYDTLGRYIFMGLRADF